MVIGRFAGDMLRGVGRVTSGVAETLTSGFSDPTLRLGVTGLSDAGKTVFITSLVANMLDRSRMGRMRGVAGGHIEAAYLQPQPDDTLPRFDYERNLAALTGADAHWPDSTRHISQLRLSFRVRPGGLLAGLRGAHVQHVDIIDYPGEWLLDLVLLDKSYDAWATEVIENMRKRSFAAPALDQLLAAETGARHDEATAQALARTFTEYLQKARAEGLPDISPGRFILPGDLAGSPVLTFAPLPGEPGPRGSLRREMARRYDAYRAQVVRPFFRDHFARIDRQVVLVDLMGAIHAGPEAVSRLGQTMTELLAAFRPGRSAWLTRLMGGRRVERILFAATKADHLHHSQHDRLTTIMTALLRQSRNRADFAGAQTQAMAIAALRTTVEETHQRNGVTLDCVRGRLMETGRQAAFHAGDLPEDPMHILAPDRHGTATWLRGDYQIMRFSPASSARAGSDGLPHIRLDRAAEFLIGDLLQ